MSKKEVWDELVTHLPALRAFAINLTRDLSVADDMVQDTVLAAWTKIESFTPGTNMRAWLFTILRNTYYSNRRRLKFEVSDPEGLFSQNLAEKPAHDGRLELRDFYRVFAELPDEQREALILVGASGFSYEEAAELCDVAVGTVKSRANRARKRLVDLLGMDTLDEIGMTDRNTQAIISGERNKRS